MDTIEKVYCTGHDNNDALVAALQQRYNDARLELSQQKQNATLIAALKTTATA